MSLHSLVKPYGWKCDLVSTLTNSGCCLSVVTYKQYYCFLQTTEAIWLHTHCDATESVLIFSSGCDLFRVLYLPKHLCIFRCLKCSNLRDRRQPMNFLICGHRTALISIQLTTQNLRHSSATSLSNKSAGCEWLDAASDWYEFCSGTERYWRCDWPAV